MLEMLFNLVITAGVALILASSSGPSLSSLKTADLQKACGVTFTAAAATKSCKNGWARCGTAGPCYDPKVSCCCRTKKGTWVLRPKSGACPDYCK